MTIEVRRIRADEWRVLRDVRLRALAEAPDAFVTTYAEAAAYPDEVWQTRAAEQATSAGVAMFLAVAGDEPAYGLAGAVFDDNGDHMVISVWVDPGWRGTGLGGRLVTAAADFIEACGDEPVLWVVDGNTRALGAYQRVGFELTGIRARHPRRPDVWELHLRRPR